jgi:hypothetical protein
MDLGHQAPQLAQVLCKIWWHHDCSATGHAAVGIAIVPDAWEGDTGLVYHLVGQGSRTVTLSTLEQVDPGEGLVCVWQSVHGNFLLHLSAIVTQLWL